MIWSNSNEIKFIKLLTYIHWYITYFDTILRETRIPIWFELKSISTRGFNIHFKRLKNLLLHGFDQNTSAKKIKTLNTLNVKIMLASSLLLSRHIIRYLLLWVTNTLHAQNEFSISISDFSRLWLSTPLSMMRHYDFLLKLRFWNSRRIFVMNTKHVSKNNTTNDMTNAINVNDSGSLASSMWFSSSSQCSASTFVPFGTGHGCWTIISCRCT